MPIVLLRLLHRYLGLIGSSASILFEYGAYQPLAVSRPLQHRPRTAPYVCMYDGSSSTSARLGSDSALALSRTKIFRG